MPTRQTPPNLLLGKALRRMRDDLGAVQRQQQYVIYDPTGATGDPANGYAVIVIGWLDDICGIAAYGEAAWNQATSTWVQLPSGGSSRVAHTYSVSGTILVASGATNYLPPFFVPVPSGQTFKLVETYYAVRSGSVTFNIEQNGSPVPAFTGLVATSTKANTTTTPISAADGDEFSVVVTGAGGDGLSVSLFFDVTS